MTAVRPARDAYDAFGMNLHLYFQSPTSTWKHTDAALGWVTRLGVGRVRQSLPRVEYSREVVRYGMGVLSRAGVGWCCPVVTNEGLTDLATARDVINDQLDELERYHDLSTLLCLPGTNEPNGNDRAAPNWAQQTRWAQQALYEETRRRSAFDHVLIQGPPMNMKRGVIEDVAAVGDLSQWLDRGDAHLYTGDRDVEYTAVDRCKIVEPLFRGKPVSVTEGGWSTCTPEDGRTYTGGASPAPELVAAVYAPKAPLAHLLAGRQGFYDYELLDEAPPFATTEIVREGSFGKVRCDSLDPATWRAKASFEAMRRYLDLFRDTPGHTPAPLAYSTSGGDGTLRQALFHRSDGKHLLALWRSVDVYSWPQRKHLPVASQTITVTLPMAMPVSVATPSKQDGTVSRGTVAKLTVRLDAHLRVLVIG